MGCNNVTINKKRKVYIYIYNIYIKLDNRINSYTIIYSYTVSVNLMLICIELLQT